MDKLEKLYKYLPKDKIDWDLILNTLLLPFKDDLRNTPQEAKWHGEGDVLTHTIMVCEELIKLDGLLIEVVGTWLWISGETFKHKSIFNKYKMRWNKMRKLWQYDSTGEYKRTKNKRSDEEIKSYFGSEVIADNRNKRTDRRNV